jgi:drug/metabolite transporter (DMT)-like permease
MGIFILREKLSLFQFSGFITAGAGFIIFYIDQLDHTLVSKSDYRLSVLYLVLASIGWATYAVLQKKLVRTWPAQQLNLVIYGLPVLLFLPLSDFQTYTGHDFATWILLIFLGLNTLIAYGALSSSFKYIEANKISIIITLNPVLTFVLMAFLTWLDVKWLEPEPVSFWGFAGGALVLAGAIMVVSKRKTQ